MEFLSPVSDIFTQEKEFNSIIKQAKGCQLDYSLKKLKEFSFLNNEIMDEIMPEDSPEILLEQRRNMKYL